MIRLFLLLTAVAFCTHCTESRQPLTTPNHRSADSSSASGPQAPANPPAVPAASAAQKATIDPDSGELISGPAAPDDSGPQTLRQTTAPAATEDLNEEPSPVPGGGMMIDLQGRFQSPVSATVDGDRGAPVENPAVSATESNDDQH